MVELISEEFGYYPLISESAFQEKLLYHTEFNELIYPIIEDKDLSDADKISLIKSKILTASITLTPYQEFVSRFISSYTPYPSLLLFHSPGSGKTLSVLKMIKNNMNFIVNQNSQVYIVVSRKILKSQWQDEIMTHIPEMMSYIRLITYKSLYNKTVGERKVVIDQTNLEVKKQHVRSQAPELEFDNCIIVLEEAHNLTNNSYTTAVTYIKERAKNIKVVALTATPIKNMIDEIIDIFNFLIFDKTLEKKDYFKYTDGKPVLVNPDRLRRDITGYVSTVKINESIYLCPKVDVGKLGHGLEYIKTVDIRASKIQEHVIKSVLKIKKDSLGRIFESLSNIFFPFINDKGRITPVYGNAGYDLVRKQVAENPLLFNNRLAYALNLSDINFLNVENDRLTGKLFSLKYIRFFSSKIYFFMKLIKRLVGNVFVYSKYKLIVIEILREVLISDGFEDLDAPERGIEAQKRCYNCMERKQNHTAKSHTWLPARFFICDAADTALFNKIRTFNSSDNIDGKLIRMILSSEMINEGVSLKNTIHVVKFDASLTMARNEQIERRAIRLNSHNDYILQNNRIPNVYVYNFALLLSDGTSNEVGNYKICERKHRDNLVVDRILQEASIDAGVYTSPTHYRGPVNTMTSSLIERENRVDLIISYLVNLFRSINMIKFSSIKPDLVARFNNMSIILAFKYLFDNEKIFISKIQNEVFIFSNFTAAEEDIDNKFLNIDNFYNISKSVAEEQYFYDIEYITSKQSPDIRGIVSTKFKLKFSNRVIEQLKLNLVKIKASHENLYLLKGWICNQSINKQNLKMICDIFKLKFTDIRSSCAQIREYLYNLEKYTDKNIHYLVYPKNHPDIPFPLNIYDNLKLAVTSYEAKGYAIANYKEYKHGSIKSFDDHTYDVVSFSFDATKGIEKIHAQIK